MTTTKSIEVYRSSSISYSELLDILSKVPEEYKDSLDFEIDEESDYGSTWHRISVSYLRPETKKEELDRVGKEVLAREAQKTRELEQLKKLQEKYKDL